MDFVLHEAYDFRDLYRVLQVGCQLQNTNAELSGQKEQC